MAEREKGTKIPPVLAKVFAGLHGLVYRFSGGRLGGSVKTPPGAPDLGGQIVVLETTGAKSGKTRRSPLISIDHGDGWAVVASYSGHDMHPGWYHNLQAHPEAALIVGNERHEVLARNTSGAERAELWDQVSQTYPDYAKYQRVTDRVIPIVALARR